MAVLYTGYTLRYTYKQGGKEAYIPGWVSQEGITTVLASFLTVLRE